MDFSKLQSPMVNIPTIKPPVNSNLASEFHSRLVEMINEFDDGLDPSQEVGMRLVSFGQTVQFHVEDIGYYNPSLIQFFGRTDSGDKIELIQHVSQISFLLMAVKRLDPEKPKKRIGFSEEGQEE
ncbi:DUF6173 family protein [Bacillus sp. CH30_1T]|uniref:DUF6173 family protein n=1 Tax=Bacillus sp. CH30_1T TaxID=2604836 RepID=UPI001CAA872A|nr:DUF6173 family protein [Bacillus sp. CH30_1T]